MPRDSNGNYTLPSGNPVVTGTVIAAGWANPTMGDIGNELTNSLDRQGRGGMLAPFKFLDGTAGAPGMTWTTEPTMGFFRAGASDMEATVAGVPRMRWTSVGVDVWDTLNSNWLPLTTAAGSNFALLNAANVFTDNQRVQGAGKYWLNFKDVTPTKAARFGLGSSVMVDGTEVGHFDGSNWYPVIASNVLETDYYGNAHIWRSSGGTVRGAIDTTGSFSLGTGTYPGSVGATLKLGASDPTSAEVGAYSPDGTNNARVSMFTLATGFCGLNYTFSSGPGYFNFQRAGTTTFRYDNFAVEALAGVVYTARSANNVLSMSMGHDTNAGYFSTGSGSAAISFYPENVRTFDVRQAAINIFAEVPLRFNNAGQTAFAALNYNVDSQGGPQIRLSSNAGSRGAVLHHDSSSYSAGGVVVSSSAAAATGPPGVIYLQVV